MKQFILGLIFGIILFLGSLDAIKLTNDHYVSFYYNKYDNFDAASVAYEKDFPILNTLYYKTISPGLGIVDTLSGRCTNDLRRDTTRRLYFRCNKVEIFFSDLIFR